MRTGYVAFFSLERPVKRERKTRSFAFVLFQNIGSHSCKLANSSDLNPSYTCLQN